MLNFDEIELNYILEAVQHFREVALRKVIRPEDQAVYMAELDSIIEKTVTFLDEDLVDSKGV